MEDELILHTDFAGNLIKPILRFYLYLLKCQKTRVFS